VLIADDRLVICGSANINDRSQLGNHDSEIAVVIEDPETVESMMNGRPYTASRFAASLRRQLFRKHLGLLPDQRWDRPTRAWTPIGYDAQEYDWGSRSDQVVADPMSSDFLRLWADTARSNTDIFSKVFHPVPNDAVRNWEQYSDFFSRHFIIPGVEYKEHEKEGRVDYGHVVREEFPGGVSEVKEWLSKVRGTLVDMPLQFLVELGEDLAMEGVGLNFATKEIYT
jgi:phospholipase D1/2